MTSESVAGVARENMRIIGEFPRRPFSVIFQNGTWLVACGHESCDASNENLLDPARESGESAARWFAKERALT